MGLRLGQPGERETTQHGVVNDITVPVLRLRKMILYDEILIAALMLLLPVGATIVKTWILPVFFVGMFVILCRNAFDDLETVNEYLTKLFYLAVICGVIFGIGVLLKDVVSERLQQASDAIWQWPPKVGLFLNRVAFLSLPFFVPVFARIPLLTRFFRITLLDPTWPSPRTAQDIEGIQQPDAYLEDEPEPELISNVTYPITTNGRKKSHGKPTQQKRGDWFAPKKNDNGLAEFGKAILENKATFSEKGSRKTSPNPKLGALYYGYTQEEYAKLRKIGIELGLVEKQGNGYELTTQGIEAMLKAIIQTLGESVIPKGYENWLDD